MSDFYVPSGSQQPSGEQGFESYVPWVRELATQNKWINAEHHAILDRLNDLLHALPTGNATRISMACDVLAAAARTHFEREDKLMGECDYPDRRAHLDEHDDLLRGLARIRFALTSDIGHWHVAGELSMLEDWFVPHLTHTDKELADYIAARNRPRPSQRTSA